MTTLRQRLRQEEHDQMAVATQARSAISKQISQLVLDATVSRTDVFASIKARAEAMITERKEHVIGWDPVTNVVDIARAQGGAAALRELVGYFEEADKKAALAQKQTTGQ
jgi:hypothetical protein